MAAVIRLSPEDKLEALRRLDEFRYWHSLDDCRYCQCCERTITGRQIELMEPAGAGGATRVHCPTESCVSGPGDWAYADPVKVAALIGPAVRGVHHRDSQAVRDFVISGDSD